MATAVVMVKVTEPGSGDDDSGDAGEGGGTGTGYRVLVREMVSNTGEGGVSDETTTDEISTIAPW